MLWWTSCARIPSWLSAVCSKNTLSTFTPPSSFERRVCASLAFRTGCRRRLVEMSPEVSNELSEVLRLRRGLNDLAGLAALGAKWAAGDTSSIARTLLEVLVQMLGLDFAYANVSEPSGTSAG